jgi:FkbM family methyltransferase
MTTPLIEVQFNKDQFQPPRDPHDTIGHNFHKLLFADTKSAPAIVKEIFSDNYHVLRSKIEIRPGDVIIDAGANEGMFSVMMSAAFPEARILAFEPIRATWQTLKENLRRNACENVQAFNVGLGAPGQSWVKMNVSKDYSGGSTKWCTHVPSDHRQEEVALNSLDEIFRVHNIDRCRLLKMDIEGSEYEVLYPAEDILRRVDYMAAEFHINQRLEFETRRIEGLISWVSNRTKLIHVDICRMAE